VESSLWLEIGAQRRRCKNQIKALPFCLAILAPVSFAWKSSGGGGMV
jgi:hypothetical protein